MIPDATRATQRAKILQLLIQARGGWVGLPKIRIRNKSRDVGGQRHSWFRLESTLATPQELKEKQLQAPSTPALSPPEFGELAPDRS